MPKFRVKIEKTLEAEEEWEALEKFKEWMEDAESNAELNCDAEEVDVEEVK